MFQKFVQRMANQYLFIQKHLTQYGGLTNALSSISKTKSWRFHSYPSKTLTIRKDLLEEMHKLRGSSNKGGLFSGHLLRTAHRIKYDLEDLPCFHNYTYISLNLGKKGSVRI